jgi:single-strand DNA-binding protein
MAQGEIPTERKERMPDNFVEITGNLTRDPEMRFTKGGTPVAGFSVAVNKRRQENGEWKTETSFFEVVAWQELGANVCSSLTKGNRVVVQGRIEQRSWETEDGSKRSVVEIVADDVAPSLRWATAVVTKVESRDAPRQAQPQQGYPDSATGAARNPEEDIF